MTSNIKKQVQLRHELKYQLGRQEDLVLTGRLRQLFSHDGNAGEDGSYVVNSLYFDTPYDRALLEKINGVSRREKFRIRYYGCDASFLKLEKKYKINGLCGKRSTRMTGDQVQRLIDGDYEFLLESGDVLMQELYCKMKGEGLAPKTIVCYDREAFVYEPGNVRVTLDRNVRTGLGSIDFLNPEVLKMNAMEQVSILEVKYDAFLPEIVQMAVQIPGQRAEACSKYAVCRRYE